MVTDYIENLKSDAETGGGWVKLGRLTILELYKSPRKVSYDTVQ